MRTLPLLSLLGASLALPSPTPQAPQAAAAHGSTLERSALRTGRSGPITISPGSPGPGGPMRVLAPADQAAFERGRALFERDFHRSSGLGAPEMNADSCRACHRDPLSGGAGGLDLNVSRFARDNGGAGPFENLPGGQTLSKLRPPYVKGREEYVPGEADVFEQRQTPALFGDGLIETIPEAAILAHEDPLDKDHDGIRGVARKLTIDGHTELGRFGWKGQVPHLADFIRDALGSELGLTTSDDGRGFALLADTDAVADPELTDPSLADMLVFLGNLAAPQRVGSVAPEVLLGELVFDKIGCAKCHVPELAGADGPVPLFSDLLLHQIMPAGFRGMSEPGAGPGVYRTPPLWGVHASAPYMHDGRASNLRAAILAHDGEALGVRKVFTLRATAEQEALLAFLADL